MKTTISTTMIYDHAYLLIHQTINYLHQKQIQEQHFCFGMQLLDFSSSHDQHHQLRNPKN